LFPFLTLSYIIMINTDTCSLNVSYVRARTHFWLYFALQKCFIVIYPLIHDSLKSRIWIVSTVITTVYFYSCPTKKPLTKNPINVCMVTHVGVHNRESWTALRGWHRDKNITIVFICDVFISTTRHTGTPDANIVRGVFVPFISLI